MMMFLLACAPLQALRQGELPLDYQAENGRLIAKTTGGSMVLANLKGGTDPTWPGYSDLRVKAVRDFDGDNRLDALVVLVPADRSQVPALAFVALSADGGVVRTAPFGMWVDRLLVTDDGLVYPDADDPGSAFRFRGGVAEGR